jgi:hypothetical protein
LWRRQITYISTFRKFCRNISNTPPTDGLTNRCNDRMSKSSTSVQRNSSTAQLSSRSAWSKGPPQSVAAAAASSGTNSPRSNSPAINLQNQQQQQSNNVNLPTASHSRRSSTLSGGRDILVGTGVSTSVPRSIPAKSNGQLSSYTLNMFMNDLWDLSSITRSVWFDR